MTRSEQEELLAAFIGAGDDRDWTFDTVLRHNDVFDILIDRLTAWYDLQISMSANSFSGTYVINGILLPCSAVYDDMAHNALFNELIKAAITVEMNRTPFYMSSTRLMAARSLWEEVVIRPDGSVVYGVHSIFDPQNNKADLLKLIVAHVADMTIEDHSVSVTAADPVFHVTITNSSEGREAMLTMAVIQLSADIARARFSK